MSEANVFHDILQTKLYRPRLPSTLVSRNQLLERLEANCHRPLTLVSAAAGYGKTTLISSWLEGSDVPSAWLSLDERDNDLVTFLTYFIAAIQTRFPTACQDTLTLLHGSTLPPLSFLTRNLTNELDQIETFFIFVLDDFHFILDAAINDLLNDMMRHPSRTMRLVLITRRDPALPVTVLRARDLITEIRSRDLRFTVNETTDLVERTDDIELDETAIIDLAEKSEGWVTGLRLSILALRHGAGRDPLAISAMENLHLHVADYLMAEVISDQPPAIQEFLIKTSILETLNGSLCDAVAELDEPECDGSAYLEWLEEANLFTLPIESGRRTYRYHPLFREHLHDRLTAKTDADGVAALHKRASTWLAENGMIEEALHHALAAGDTAKATDLVAEYRHDLMNREQFNVLERWLNLLPREAIEGNAELLLVEAWLWEYRFNFGELFPLLERVAGILEDDTTLAKEDRTVLGGELASLRSSIFYWMGHGQLSLENARHAVKVTPFEHEWVRGLSLSYHAGAYQLVGQLDKVYEEIHKILAAGGGRANTSTHRAYDTLVAVETLAGNLSGLEQVALQQLEFTEPRQLYRSLGWAQYGLAFVYYQRNELAEARASFAQLVELKYRAHAASVAQGYYGLALTYQALGDHDLAWEAFRAALDWASETGSSGILIEAQSLASRLALLEEQVPDVSRWATLISDEIPLIALLQFPHLTLASVLLAQGTPGALLKAGELLAQLRQAAESTYNTWRLMEITAMQALLSAAQGKRQEALATLEQVIIWAEARGYIRLFADLGPQMAGLLDELRGRSVAPDYVALILAAFPASGSTSTSPDAGQSLNDPLTNRELQTVRLLATDLSIEDIAAELVVSVATVRTHCKRIYRKLNVHSRFEAAQQTNKLGLL
jgi:LuxR family maltose regulon positive regulatory protein